MSLFPDIEIILQKMHLYQQTQSQQIRRLVFYAKIT